MGVWCQLLCRNAFAGSCDSNIWLQGYWRLMEPVSLLFWQKMGEVKCSRNREVGEHLYIYSILELCSLGGTEVSSQKMWISASPPPTTTFKAAERPPPCAVPGVSPPGPCDVPPSGFLEPSSGWALGASTAIYFFQQLIWHNLPTKITTRKPIEKRFPKKPAADLNGMTPSWSLSFLSRFRSLRDFSEKSEEGPEGAVDGAASRSGSAESSCSISPLDGTG